MNSITSNKKRINGVYHVTVSCMKCFSSFEIKYHGWKNIICFECGNVLVRSNYLTKAKIEKNIVNLEQEIKLHVISISKGCVLGHSPVFPYKSYRLLQNKLTTLKKLL